MNSASRAHLAARPPTPTGRCVAVPREGNQWGAIYRGADHMRCSHPTPTPPGTYRCEGENGCPFRLTPEQGRFCWYHDGKREEFLGEGGGGGRSAEWGGPQPLSGNWTTR